MATQKNPLPITKDKVAERVTMARERAEVSGIPRHMLMKKGNKVYIWYGDVDSKQEATEYIKKYLTGVDATTVKHNDYTYEIWVR
jgi:hypothetical protein